MDRFFNFIVAITLIPGAIWFFVTAVAETEAYRKTCRDAGRDYVTMDYRVVCKDRVTGQLYIPQKP
jgi:hypothetical protein